MIVLFAAASECSASRPRWKRFEYSHENSWENVRYGLEMKMLRNRRRHVWSYFAAMRYDQWKTARRFVPAKSLRANDRVGASERVVLFRKPFPASLARGSAVGGHVSAMGVYVPPWFRTNIDNHMSEDEKIAAAMTNTDNLFKKQNELEHPAEYSYLKGVPTPPKTYTCHGCGVEGVHFRPDCPADDPGGDEDVNTQPRDKALDKVQRPHGIPKSMLCKVSESDRGKAMKDNAGNYVVRIQTHRRLVSTFQPEPTQPCVDLAPVSPPVAGLVEQDRPVDWCMADQFCVDQKRSRPLSVEHPQGALPTDQLKLDFETSIELQDEKMRRYEREFYAAHPTKRRKRPSTCTHWLRGLCVKSAMECEFMHNASPEWMPVCKFFSDGVCSNEDMCLFRHVSPPEKLPPPCPAYVDGFCKDGPKCSLTHAKRTEPRFSDWVDVGRSRDEYNAALMWMR